MKKIVLLFAITFTSFAFGQYPGLQWARVFDCDGFSTVTNTYVDNVGSTFVVGHFTGTIDFDLNAGLNPTNSSTYNALFIVKYDGFKNVIWWKTITSNGNVYAQNIVKSSDGTLYISGTFSSPLVFSSISTTLTPQGLSEGFLLKLDGNGDPIWARQFKSTETLNIRAIQVDENQTVYVSGTFKGTCDLDPGPNAVNYNALNRDAFIVGINANGNLNWSKVFPGSPTASCNPFGMHLTSTGEIYLVGSIYDGSVNFDSNGSSGVVASNGIYSSGFVLKISSLGVFSWVKKLGSTFDLFPEEVRVLSNGDPVVVGAFSGTADFDPNSPTYDLTSSGDFDVFILRLNSQGNFVWAKKMGNLKQDYPSEITVDPNDNIYIVGSFKDSTVLNQSGTKIYSIGMADGFAAKYDANGNHIWSFGMGSINDDYLYTVIYTPAGKLFISGNFSGGMDADPTANSYPMMPYTNNNDLFFMELHQNQLGISDVIKVNLFTVFPNPSKGEFHVSFDVNNEIDEIQIFDNLGHLIHSQTIASEGYNTTLPFEKGLYFIRLKLKNGAFTTSQKLILE